MEEKKKQEAAKLRADAEAARIANAKEAALAALGASSKIDVQKLKLQQAANAVFFGSRAACMIAGLPNETKRNTKRKRNETPNATKRMRFVSPNTKRTAFRLGNETQLRLVAKRNATKWAAYLSN